MTEKANKAIEASMDELLIQLEEITVCMFEALHADKFAELEDLVQRRHHLIEALVALSQNDPELDSTRLDRTLRSGAALIQRCQDKWAELLRVKKQHVLARSTIRGYRPNLLDPISTRRYNS